MDKTFSGLLFEQLLVIGRSRDSLQRVLSDLANSLENCFFLGLELLLKIRDELGCLSGRNVALGPFILERLFEKTDLSLQADQANPLAFSLILQINAHLFLIGRRLGKLVLLSYLLGSAELMGLKFRVEERDLIREILHLCTVFIREVLELLFLASVHNARGRLELQLLFVETL